MSSKRWSKAAKVRREVEVGELGHGGLPGRLVEAALARRASRG